MIYFVSFFSPYFCFLFSNALDNNNLITKSGPLSENCDMSCVINLEGVSTLGVAEQHLLRSRGIYCDTVTVQ